MIKSKIFLNLNQRIGEPVMTPSPQVDILDRRLSFSSPISEIVDYIKPQIMFDQDTQVFVCVNFDLLLTRMDTSEREITLSWMVLSPFSKRLFLDTHEALYNGSL